MPSNQRLDPLGIYGTRSASRQQAAKRRRRLQHRLVAVAALVGVGGVFFLWKQSPSPSEGVTWSVRLPLRVSAPPALANSEMLLIADESGQVRAVGLKSAAQGRVLYGDAPVGATSFPLQSAPLAFNEQIFLPGQDGTLTALNWKTGRVNWLVETGSAITASPVTVFLPSKSPASRLSAIVVANDSGLVEAFDSRSGKSLWRQRLGGPAGDAVAKSLIDVSGNRIPVIFVPTGIGVAERGGLVCLDGRNGQVRWKFPSDGRIFASTLGAPALNIDDGGVARTIYFASLDGVVTALDPATGKVSPEQKSNYPRWSTKLTPLPNQKNSELVGVPNSPTWLSEEKLLVLTCSDNSVRALHGEDGSPAWRFHLNEPSLTKARLVEAGGNRLLIVSDGKALVYGLDPSTGRQRRKWKINGSQGAIWTDISPSGGEILALNEDCFLQGIRL